MDLKPAVQAEEPTVVTPQERRQDIEEGLKAKELQEHNRQELIKKEAELRRLLTDIETRQRKKIEEQRIKKEQEAAAIAARNELPPEVKSFILAKITEEGLQLSSLIQRLYEKRKAALSSELTAVSMSLQPANNQNIDQSRAPEGPVAETSKNLMPDVRRETAAQTEQVGADAPPLKIAI